MARRDHVQQTIAVLVALAVSLGGFFWGTHMVGRAGVLVLIVSVPAGIFFGWLTAKLFEFAEGLLND